MHPTVHLYISDMPSILGKIDCLVAVAHIWWHHQMETFSALLAICAGNSPVSGEFPAQRPVTRSFDIFFDLRLNKRLSKQSCGWWFETLSCPLWCRCNEHHPVRNPHHLTQCHPSPNVTWYLAQLDRLEKFVIYNFQSQNSRVCTHMTNIIEFVTLPANFSQARK